MNPWLQLLHPGRLVRWALIAVIAAIVVVLGVFPVLLGVLVSSSEDDAPEAGACAPLGVPADFTSPQWDTEQLSNASVIVQRAQGASVGPQGATVALATAMQESGLRNLSGGDRDSAGLFQQRPSTGWGNLQQIRNPVLASDAFFGVATHTTNKGLTDYPQWSQTAVTVAAQTVQASAFPDAYAKWEPEARDLAEQLYTGDAGPSLDSADLVQANQLCAAGSGVPPVAGYPPAEPQCSDQGDPMEVGLQPSAVHGLRCVRQQFVTSSIASGWRAVGSVSVSDHPAGLAIDVTPSSAAYESPDGNRAGWQMAHWFQINAKRLGVKYIIWDNWTWNPAKQSGSWVPYVHATGRIDPSARHEDHVHVSFHKKTDPDAALIGHDPKTGQYSRGQFLSPEEALPAEERS